MYVLKRDANLSFLIGREVIQVAIGVHHVIFHFEEDISISVGGEFEYSDDQGTVVWKPGASRAAANTVVLLGAKIESLASFENGTIVIHFSNGARLVIPDPSAEYESYQITRPGETIVV